MRPLNYDTKTLVVKNQINKTKVNSETGFRTMYINYNFIFNLHVY